MGRTIFIGIVTVLLCALVGVAAVFLLRPAMNFDWLAAQPTATAPPPGTPIFGTDLGKPKPVVDYYKGCPPSGDGGDPLLNTLKNRIDETTWEPVTAQTLLSIPWPEAIEGRPRSRWSEADKEEVARYEGTPIQLEGYLISAKKQGPETCNCRSVEDVDFHIWLAAGADIGRESSVVIETTPRVMAVHPQWTISRINTIARNKERVRISGWVMMDPEHPDQIGKTRGTIWEIHPVMQIETMQFGEWTPLDSGTTGIRASIGGDTPLDITPVPTATTPPVSDTTVQNNKVVRITTIFYDGTQGREEPDEYVAITNTGAEPVEITDWELQDTTGQAEYKWESYSMQPGQTIRVYTNKTDLAPGEFSFHASRAIWSNSGDIAELYDPDKELVSRYAYGNKR
ncbi:MAG: lamin tail domain-containing protein [Chloroflexia bacterium]